MQRSPSNGQMLLPWQAPTSTSVEFPVKPGTPSTNITAGAESLLAPAPMIDRYPVVIGNALSLQYITSTYRQATNGWRWQAVDVWNELLEHDPHARGVVRQRLLPVVAARLDFIAAELPEDATEKDKRLAKDIRDEVARQWRGIPARTQALGRLAWGVAYGMSACENEWDRDTSSPAPRGWEVRGLHFIHSRRLNVTNPSTWDVYIYDQGPGSPWAVSNSFLGYGLRIADYPAKFTLHCPALNGDYATRDGELRYVGVYMALKRMIVRCTAQDFERVIRPWVLGYFNREADKNRLSVATTADINQLLATVKSLGLGSLNSAVLPDAVRVEILKQAASAGNPREFADWLDHQVTESLLGQTYTTGPASHGTHESAGVAADGTRRINEYDAQCLADTIQRDLVYWIVALNWSPEIARRFAPTARFAISETPDPKRVAEVAKILTALDVPLDARKVGDMCQMPVVPDGDDETMESGRTRVIVASPDRPIEPSGDDPNEGQSPQPSADAAAQAAKTEADAAPGKPATTPRPKTGPGGKTAKKSAKKSAKKGATGAAKRDAENGAAMRLMADKVFLAEDAALEAAHRLLLSDRADSGPALAVYTMLLEDYPARHLGWILSAQWRGPIEVPIADIDFTHADKWRASHEDITPYVERFRKGKRKPAVMVQTPGNPKVEIVDGHHRTLASKALDWDVLTYVADVQTDIGPWVSLHGAQKKGSSKGSYPKDSTASREPASWLVPDEVDDNA